MLRASGLLARPAALSRTPGLGSSSAARSRTPGQARIVWCQPRPPRAVIGDVRFGSAAPGGDGRPVDRAEPGSRWPSMGSVAAITRVKSPVPSLMLMWPCLWSAGMACPPGSLPAPLLLVKFATGAFLMRSAGCVMNDMLDQRIDRAVLRTRSRPLAAGTMTMAQATWVLSALLASSLGILLTFDWYCIALGASSVLLVSVYPLMKRYVSWPQVVLGLAFNFGAILGWASVQGGCQWSSVLPLYASGVAWTIVYDTIYAHQDKHDDRRLGIGSTALLFGDRHAKAYLSAFASSSMGLLAASGYAADMHSIFYGSVAAASMHLALQIWFVDIDSRASCLATFMSNAHLGGVIAAGVFLDRAFL